MSCERAPCAHVAGLPARSTNLLPMVTAQLAALAVFWAAISVLRVWPPQWLRRSLQKGSIELAPARLTLNTVALNPALHRVAGATSARRREFWKQWYNAGVHVFFVLLVFVTAFLAWNLRARCASEAAAVCDAP